MAFDQRRERQEEMSAAVKSIWQEVQDNRKALDSCSLHQFEPPEELKLGDVYTCKNCGGKKRISDISDYIHGYEAAGGNANDIWPGWRKKKS